MRPTKSSTPNRVSFWGAVAVLALFCFATANSLPAQTLTTLHAFAGYPTDGASPYAGLVQATDGNFYGTTYAGGTSGNCQGGCGTVFRITPAGTLTTLHSFDWYDGASPTGALVQGNDGNFYGTTYGGGADPHYGTVFKITPAGALTTLYSFCAQANCADGAMPYAGLVRAPDGNFYGTTLGGGSNNGCSLGSGSCGTVFKITPGGTLTTLYSFCAQHGCADGGNPYAGLVQASDGNFYGTTFGRGVNGYGTVFKITPAGALTSLYSFCSQMNCADGEYPQAGLVQATDGNFYGTTPEGGGGVYHQGGTVFKITSSGTLTTLYNFCSLPACADGADSLAALLQGTDGNFYGTTIGGGAYCTANSGCGTVFKITPSGSLTTLHSFDDTDDGKAPFARLVHATDGNFYGTTAFGANPACTTGLHGCGTVFRLTGPPPSTTTVTSSPNPSTFGDVVTITATVGPLGPPAPTGSVSFTSNGVTISGCTAVPLTSQLTAVCTTSTLAVGTDAIVATYSGDANYSGSSGTLSQLVNPTPSPLQFVAVTPCRLVDTRPDRGGSGPIPGGTFQSFPIPQEGGCNIPDTAAAYSLNVSVVPQGQLGYLTIWPTGEGRPVVATLNSLDGRIKADAAIVPAGANGAVSVYVTNTTNVILDINGYFAPVSGSTLAFYPLTPCRVADTRNSSYPQGLGPPYLHGLQERDFPILNATSCNIPASAAAYSLNFSVVPHGPLGYMTVWPTGQSRPVVSTLNDLPAQIIANAALVPVGASGKVSVYPSNDTDLIIDINGYFAPAGTGGLSLYAVAPCRVIDTRQLGPPFSGTLTPPVNVTGSFCGPPATAQAYVFNATVVPTGGLGYLTLWPDGEPKPLVSTLNALDGSITNNMAIVPSPNGKVDAFASGITQLILDISSYFAP
jgi:uncharacterized repeat protein (TIGR03803 family)